LVEETYLFDSPIAYYPLGEPEGATMAADVSGNAAASLTLVGDSALPIVFGQATGPGTDDLTAATFTGGEWLSGPMLSATSVSIEAFFSSATAPSTAFPARIVGFGDCWIQQDAAGEVTARIDGFTSTGIALTDGATHHVAATWNGTTFAFYADGALVSSTTPAATFTAGQVTVGGNPDDDITLIGVVAHAAVYSTALSSTRVTAHYDAGTTGFASELASARLARYAEMAGIPTAEVDAETSVAVMTHVDTTNGQVVDLLRLCETTEGGVLYDALDGTLTFHNRSHRYDATSLFTLDMSQQEVEADYSPRMDASMLSNDVTVTSPSTSAHVKDDTSIEANGLATASVTIADEDDDAPIMYASWAVYVFKDPKVRTPTLSVDALAQVGKTPNCSAVLAATIGDKVTVSNHPAQAQASSVDYYIEGGTYAIGPESLVVTWNVTPSSPDDLTLIAGDATRGVVGTNVVAF
jgi:hypothetical protein